MFAPTVNSYKRYQPESWAPTALAWSIDNRTCGFRVVGHGPSFRLESRIPGGDVNPYLAYAATIAAGLHGIEHGIAPPPRFDGNAYAAEELARVPSSLAEACDALATSKVAADAFGTDVHDHLLNTARQELARNNLSLVEIALEFGFGSQANFTRVFRKAASLTPGQYRELCCGQAEVKTDRSDTALRTDCA